MKSLAKLKPAFAKDESIISPAEEVAPTEEERKPVQIEKGHVHPGISEEGTDIVIADLRKNEFDLTDFGCSIWIHYWKCRVNGFL